MATDVTYPVLTPKGRLITGAELRRAHPVGGQIDDDTRQPFFLDQARLGVEVEFDEHVSAELSAELTSARPVRDAYLDVELHRAFRVHAGRFKRPLSRIANQSLGQLPFRDRGIFNQLLLKDAAWGDRAVGVMFWGRVKEPRLRWQAALMNAAPSDVPLLDQSRGFDALGRIELRLVQGVEVAVNGGHKRTETVPGAGMTDLHAIGGDVRVRAGAFHAVLESIAAQNPQPPAPPPSDGRTPFAWGAIGYATYDVPLGGGLVWQPMLVGEWVDTDTEVSEDETIRAGIGANFLWGAHLRLLPQVEVVRPVGQASARSQTKSETYSLALAVEL